MKTTLAPSVPTQEYTAPSTLATATLSVIGLALMLVFAHFYPAPPIHTTLEGQVWIAGLLSLIGPCWISIGMPFNSPFLKVTEFCAYCCAIQLFTLKVTIPLLWHGFRGENLVIPILGFTLITFVLGRLLNGICGALRNLLK